MSTIEQLRTSADRIKKSRPSYGEILEFYSRVFEAQEESQQSIALSPVILEKDILKLKKESNMPLIDPSQFIVDETSAAGLLDHICSLAQDLAPQLSKEGETLQRAVGDGTIMPQELFKAILENRDSDLEIMAENLKISVSKLSLFGFLAMSPSLCVCARQLESYIEKKDVHHHGYCPVCGNQANLAILDEDGRRHLKCSFCSHQWLTKRMGCVFCRNTDPEKQLYFYSDDEKEYRVNLCDACNNYIKVVDLRQMNRYFYPGLELISTLHLDLQAQKKGYVNSVEL